MSDEASIMRLTVLGNGPVSPNPGGACSGYLVRSPGASLVLDCGTGVAAAPALKAALPDLSAVVISHLHIDHWLDLAPLAYELKYAPVLPRREPLDVWVPPGAGQPLLDLLRALMLGSTHAEEVFRVAEFEPQTLLRVGDLSVSFLEVQHYVTAYAMRLEVAGRTLVYSGDSAPCQALEVLARDADLFLCEAADPLDESPREPRGHLTALEAAQAASRAGVKELLLTHLWHQYDRDLVLRAARSAYAGPCALAEQGEAYDVV